MSCPSPERSKECWNSIATHSERIAALEVMEREHMKDIEALTAEIHENTACLRKLVSRPEFNEAMTTIDGKLVLYVPKVRYQLIEAAVIAWNGMAVFVIAGALFKFLGVIE